MGAIRLCGVDRLGIRAGSGFVVVVINQCRGAAKVQQWIRKTIAFEVELVTNTSLS